MSKLFWKIRNYFQIYGELALAYLEISFLSRQGEDVRDVMLRIEVLEERKKNLLKLKERFRDKDLE